MNRPTLGVMSKLSASVMNDHAGHRRALGLDVANERAVGAAGHVELVRPHELAVDGVALVAEVLDGQRVGEGLRDGREGSSIARTAQCTCHYTESGIVDYFYG